MGIKGAKANKRCVVLLIKRLRRAGVSFEELGAMLLRSKATIINWVNGVYEPSLTVAEAEALMKVFQVRLDALSPSEQIAELLEDHELSLAQLSKRLGVSIASINNWRSGRTVPIGVNRHRLTELYERIESAS